MVLPQSSLHILGQLGSTISELDLSFCRLALDLRPLEALLVLQSLTMDNCGLTDAHCLPYLNYLHTLRYSSLSNKRAARSSKFFKNSEMIIF